jgi:ribosomal protein S27AE
MTREEAIKILWQYDINFEPHPAEDVMHALDIAIEALEQEPTAEYSSDVISRQAAIEAIEKYDFFFPEYMERFVTELRDAMKKDLLNEVKSLPPVEPERPKGKWIATEYDTIKCGECGIVYSSALYPRKYCPNCGADMREANKK